MYDEDVVGDSHFMSIGAGLAKFWSTGIEKE
jgi:hypothetical protein